MSLFDEIDKAKNSIVLIQPVEKLNLFASLNDSYNKNSFESLIQQSYGESRHKKGISKAMLTIIHSIYENQKLVFGLSRNKLKEVYEGNPNWLKEESFSSTSYTHITQYLESMGILQLVKDARKQCRIYCVTDTFKYASHIEGDFIEQLKIALELRKPEQSDLTEKMAEYLKLYPELQRYIKG